MRTILDDSEPPRLGATNSIACGRYFRASGTLPTYVAERSLAFQLILICESARAYPQTPVKIPFELGHGDPRGGKSRGRAGNAEKNASSARCNDIGSIPEPKKKVWRAIKELTSGTSPKGRVPFDV